MKQIRFEWHKLFTTPFLCLFFGCMLVIQSGVIFFSAKPTDLEWKVRELYESYLADPASMDAYAEELEIYAWQHRREEDPEMPRTLDKEGIYDDSLLLNQLQARYAVGTAREERWQETVRTAARQQRNLLRAGYAEDGYLMASAVRLEQRYAALSDTLTGNHDVAYGYDAYLAGGTVTNFFALLVITVFTVFLFRVDRQTGLSPTLRVCRHGRQERVRSKLGAAFGMAFAVSFLFMLSAFLTVGVAGGYSSLSDAIQTVPGCENVPYLWTVGGYLAVHTALRLLGFLFYTALIVLLSSLGLSYIPCAAIGAVTVGVQYYFSTKPYMGSAPVIRTMNLWAVLDGTSPLSFWRTVNFFGKPVSQSAVTAGALYLLSVLLPILSVIVFCRREGTRRERHPWLLPKIRLPRFRSSASGKTRYGTGLIGYEWKKVRIGWLLLGAVLLLTAKGVFTAYEAGLFSKSDFGEAKYRAYLETLMPLSRGEQEEWLAQEEDRLSGIIDDQYPQMNRAFAAGEIELPAYSAFLEQYYHAKADRSVFDRVKHYAEGVFRAADACGRPGESTLIIDTGYDRYFAQPMDLFLYAAVLLLCLRTFPVEYSERGGSFAPILRTTKRGRRHTFASKLAGVVPLSGLIAVASRLISYFTIQTVFPMTDPDAPLFAVSGFFAVGAFPFCGKVTVGSYFWMDLAAAALGGMVLALLCCLCACFIKKILPTVGTVLVCSAVPAFLCAVIPAFPTVLSPVAMETPAFLFETVSRGIGYAVAHALAWSVALLTIGTVGIKKFPCR